MLAQHINAVIALVVRTRAPEIVVLDDVTNNPLTREVYHLFKRHAQLLRDDRHPRRNLRIHFEFQLAQARELSRNVLFIHFHRRLHSRTAVVHLVKFLQSTEKIHDFSRCVDRRMHHELCS